MSKRVELGAGERAQLVLRFLSKEDSAANCARCGDIGAEFHTGRLAVLPTDSTWRAYLIIREHHRAERPRGASALLNYVKPRWQYRLYGQRRRARHGYYGYH
jgi:hypothetical protein